MVVASHPDREATKSSLGSIADAAYRVKGLLVASNDCEDEEIRSFTRGQLGRFNLWSSNIGVFAARHASLDYRLRTAPTVEVAVLGNLEILCRQIFELLKAGASVLDEELDELSEKPLNDFNGWALSIIRRYPPGQTAYTPALDSISSTITTLHRLSLSIRKASERNSLRKSGMLFDFDEAYEIVRSYDARGMQSTSIQGLRYDITKEFENYVALVLRLKWLKGNENSPLIFSPDDPRKAFLERCVQAISAQRRELAYFDSHRDKLSRDVTPSTISQKVENSAVHAEAPQVAYAEGLAPSFPVRNNLVPSETVPSEFHQASFILAVPDGPVIPARRAPLSTVSSVGGALRDTGCFEVPSPPALEAYETEKICPYCTLVLPHETFEKTKEEKKWRYHLLEDLKPYVCLHRNCSLDTNALRTFSEWQKHIESPHYGSWTCPLHPEFDVSHSAQSRCFRTLTAFRNHLSTEHAALGDVEADELVLSARTPEELSDQCLICLTDISLKHEFQSHVARHLESAFLLALPWRNDIDDWGSISTGKNASATTVGPKKKLDNEVLEDLEVSTHAAQEFSAQLAAIEHHSGPNHGRPLETWAETLEDADDLFDIQQTLGLDNPEVLQPDETQLRGQPHSMAQDDAGTRPFEKYSEPSHKFCVWADEHAVEGRTSEGKPARYVPHSSQSQYWTSDKIREITQTRNSIISTKDVRDYICIFSILVYMEGKGVPALHYLEQIMRRGADDAILPFTERFNGRHDIFARMENLEKFIDTQWMFYPMPTQPFLTAWSTMAPRVLMPKPIHNRRVEAKQIFPITEDFDRRSTTRRVTGGAMISCMKIHSPSSMLQVSSVPINVVFKTFPPEEAGTYKDERDCYNALRDVRDSENILQCLGSFYYINGNGQQFSTIILECADYGTLTDLFLADQVNLQVSQVRHMWESFLGALHGLATIHDHEFVEGYIRFHPDLNPSNFFLFTLDADESPFKCTVKIGDFGSFHSRSTNQGLRHQSSRDKGATRTYGPPETSLSSTLSSTSSSLFDMWAVGCIIIEVAVWITGGKFALDEFRRERMRETKDLKQLEKLGQGDCFHDGSDVLESVRGVRQTISDNRRPHDDITLAMVDLALDYALIGKNERLHADQLIPRFYKVLREHPGQGYKRSTNGGLIQPSPGLTPPSVPYYSEHLGRYEPQFRGSHLWSPETPNFTQSPAGGVMTPPSASLPMSPLALPERIPRDIPPVQNPLTAGPSAVVRQEMPKELSKELPRELPREMSTNATKTSYPRVSIDELQKWVESSKTRNAKELRGWDETKLLLNGRDFIFLIDNSKYSKGHKEEVKTWTTSLAYLLKTIVPDGMDVANTLAPQDGKTIKNRTEMSDFVELTFAREIGGDCMIENALSIILAPLKSKWSQRQRSSIIGIRNRLSIGPRTLNSRGVTILVFTNGVWDATTSGTCGAEKPIMSLIESMQEYDIPRTQVSIQFVRLGSEPRGIRRLKILDNELKKDFDIVDTKPVTASIWDILIGPMQAGTDNDAAASS